MILHATAKLAAKLPAVAAETIATHDALGAWHGNLYVIDRRQCVMLCHDATRYVLFLAGLRKADFATLGERFGKLFLASLADLGCHAAEIAFARLALGPLQVDARTDRSVLSSLRIAKEDLEAMMLDGTEVLTLDPVVTACALNRRPATVHGKWLWPGEGMREWVAALSEQEDFWRALES